MRLGMSWIIITLVWVGSGLKKSAFIMDHVGFWVKDHPLAGLVKRGATDGESVVSMKEIGVGAPLVSNEVCTSLCMVEGRGKIEWWYQGGGIG
jgi:hypothetical protein